MNLVHEGVIDPNEPDFRDEKREAEEARRERETLANIVAEMREKAAHFEKNSELMVSENAIALFILPYADRIEAAWKREREAARAYWTKKCRDTIVEHDRCYSPVGNAAATYAALVKIHDLTNALDEECGVDPVEIRDIARAALSAPARNCDLPLSVDGPAETNANRAWHVFKCRNPGAYFDVPGLLRCIDWLLAPAAERKGECDGR